MLKFKIPLLMVAACLLAPSLLWAQGSIELLSRVEQVVVTTNEEGKKITTIEPATKVVPGETVIYTNTYRNIGEDSADEIVINNPIPEHTTYIAESAFGDNTTILFSVDGGINFANPESLKTKDEDGKERLARPEEYTNIRWILNNELEPGATGEVGFRVRLQ